MPDADREHVALVGLSGSGKSAVAPVVAEALGLGVVDLDRAVEAELGVSVSELIVHRGEPTFRRFESTALARAVEGPAAVIATGGGAVLDAGNRALLVERCRVVWLRTDLDRLLERVGSGAPGRPLLGGDVRTSLSTQAAEREALYREVASVVVGTDGLDVAGVARRIVEELSGG